MNASDTWNYHTRIIVIRGKKTTHTHTQKINKHVESHVLLCIYLHRVTHGGARAQFATAHDVDDDIYKCMCKNELL